MRAELIQALMAIVHNGDPSPQVLITLRDLLQDERMSFELKKINGLIDDVNVIKMRLGIKTSQFNVGEP